MVVPKANVEVYWLRIVDGIRQYAMPIKDQQDLYKNLRLPQASSNLYN